jgi:hypothetical protein
MGTTWCERMVLGSGPTPLQVLDGICNKNGIGKSRRHRRILPEAMHNAEAIISGPVNQSSHRKADALKNPTPSAPFAPISLEKMRALETISKIFSGAIKANLPTVQSKQEPEKQLPRVQRKIQDTNAEQRSPRVQTRYPTRERRQLVNAVIDPVTGTPMEYRHLIKIHTPKSCGKSPLQTSMGDS